MESLYWYLTDRPLVEIFCRSCQENRDVAKSFLSEN